jgi:hypothetical protein
MGECWPGVLGVRGLLKGEMAVSGFSRCSEIPRFGALIVLTIAMVKPRSKAGRKAGGLGSTD